MNYYLTLTYPQNIIFLFKGDKRIGAISEFGGNKMLTSEEIKELQDNGYLELDDRMGMAVEKYIKTGKFSLRKPVIKMQNVVRESINKENVEHIPPRVSGEGLVKFFTKLGFTSNGEDMIMATNRFAKFVCNMAVKEGLLEK